jgi:hypothetical protein
MAQSILTCHFRGWRFLFLGAGAWRCLFLGAAKLLISRRVDAISISCAFMLGLLRRASVRRTARIARSSSFNSGPEEELPPPALSFFSAHTDLQPEARLYSSLARKADALSPKFTVLPGCVTQRIS